MSRARLWIKWMQRAVLGRPLLPEPKARDLVDAGVPRSLDCRRRADRSFVLQRGSDIDVFVDGDRQRFVVAFDVDAGTVLRHSLDDRGRLKVDLARRVPVSEVVRGRVEVRWKAKPGGGM